MVKFNEKSLHNFPMAYFYAAVQAFDSRMAELQTTLQRLLDMRQEQHNLFVVLDDAYRRSLKSQSTKTIGDLDKVRDHLAYVIEKVATLWANKLDDDELNIHGRRVVQVFKDFSFRPDEALVAENAKIRNMEQVMAGADLTAALAAMGLTELNRRMTDITAQIEQLMTQRNEEQSVIIAGELKAARVALDDHYRRFITYLNAVQELQPEEGISQVAQFYNQDLKKIEMQLAQSRKGGNVSTKPTPDQGGTTPADQGGSTTPDQGGSTTPDQGGGSQGGGTTPDDEGGPSGTGE